MDVLVATLLRHEDEVAAGWLKALASISGDAFGGRKWTDPAKEVRIALKALIAILENGDPKPAEEQATRLARLPSQRGSGIMATVRGCYALFEPLRPVLDRAYSDQRDLLASDVVRLRDGVATLTGVLSVAHVRQGLAWQDQSDRFARQRLNGPLAKLVGDLQGFQAAASENLSMPLQEGLRLTLGSGRDVLRAAEGLFIMHRLGEGRLEAARVPVPLADTLGPAAEDARRKASFGNRTLMWKAPTANVSAVANADLLRRAFSFVLLRAIEETPEGNTVRAEVLDDPEAARIVIRDEGPGEAPEEGRGESFELTFAKMAIEHMDGHLDIFREPGRGTMVQLKLPRAVAAPPPKPGAVVDDPSKPLPRLELKISRGSVPTPPEPTKPQ